MALNVSDQPGIHGYNSFSKKNLKSLAVNYTKSNKTEVCDPFQGLGWNTEGPLIRRPWRFLNQGIEQGKENKRKIK